MVGAGSLKGLKMSRSIVFCYIDPEGFKPKFFLAEMLANASIRHSEAVQNIELF